MSALPHEEVSHDKPLFAWLAAGVVWLFVTALFVRTIVAEVAHDAGLGAVIGLGLGSAIATAVLVGLWKVDLVVRVEPGRIDWSFPPLWSSGVDLDEVRWAEAVRFRPLRDYGGWGVRWTPWAGWCVTAGGDVGVRLVLLSGRKIVVGSENPMRLLEAIEAARAAAPFDPDADDDADEEPA